MSIPRKKLIEVSIPLEAINAASAREKNIKVGKHTSLHQWFAPRPLATCRAVLFAQLVDDPSAWPERFPTEAARDVERRRLHKVMVEMVQWEASSNERILNAARWEIARSVAWGAGEEPPPPSEGAAVFAYLQAKAPPVYDPFSGSGSIPLEAQRLGLRAYGSDLNPVAVLIGKALVEIPPKFAGLPPVNPNSRIEIARGGRWNGHGAQGLAEDVRYYGKWMRDEAVSRIGNLYPKARLADGSEATVIAWMWARTVRSPDPVARGAMVPLVSSFLLSTKDGKKAWIEPVIDSAAPDGYRFEARSGYLPKAEEERLKKGTKSAKGQAFVCLLTGSAIDRAYVQSEGKADRLGQRLMAIVAEGNRSRIYISPTPDHELIARSADSNNAVDDARSTFLSPPTPTRAMITGGVCSAYGLRTWGHLFTSRQLVALTTFSDLVSQARARAATDARAAGLDVDETPLHAGGVGATAYADAVATYLAFIVDKNAQTLNSLVRWFAKGEKAQPIFERQAIPMVWEFAEANALGSSTGSLTNCIKYVAMTLERWGATSLGQIEQLEAQKTLNSDASLLVSTDPPYYDNIGYADLADFFYVWLRRSVSEIWPSLFRRLVSPKEEELVATLHRHGGAAGAEAFFISGMGTAIRAFRAVANDRDPITIYYAFKQSEAAQDGITSAGWASFLQAIVNAGLAVDGTWPMRTEHSSKMISQGGANVLASSIVLVCRKRELSAPVSTRAEFIRVLKDEMPDAIENIRKAGVGPVDMQQSVIGPGMGVFTRFGKVLEDDDSAMTVKAALVQINRVWEEIENELDTNFDPETQVALAWYATYGFDVRPSGEMIGLANAKNVSDRSLFESGVFKNLQGKTALTPREELPGAWSLATDKTVTVWECVQHAAHTLAAKDGGAMAAAHLVREMGSRGADARTLAYRLFEIATRKGWTAEALVYNELAQEWAHLEDLAQSIGAPLSAAGAAQGTLI